MNDKDEGAAPTGTTETTNEIKSYKFPPSRLELQPGSGTVDHPLESYFKDKVLYAFDCLLITSECIHFGEEQIKVMNEAQKYNTPVVLLITKLEQAVGNEVDAQFDQNQDYHPTPDEYRSIVENTIKKLRSYVETQQNILPPKRIFVISAKKFRAYLNLLAAGNGANAEKDLLVSGEMEQLIKHISNETFGRRN